MTWALYCNVRGWTREASSIAGAVFRSGLGTVGQVLYIVFYLWFGIHRYRILLLAYCCGGFFLVLDQELIFEFL